MSDFKKERSHIQHAIFQTYFRDSETTLERLREQLSDARDMIENLKRENEMIQKGSYEKLANRILETNRKRKHISIT